MELWSPNVALKFDEMNIALFEVVDHVLVSSVTL